MKVMYRWMILTAIILVAAASVPAWAQVTVSNVSFTQGPDGTTKTKVDIYYDLATTAGSCNVTASLSTDNGATFPQSVSTAIGDLSGVATGINKHIEWDIVADVGSLLNTATAVIMVTAISVNDVQHIIDGGFPDSAVTSWIGWLPTRWELVLGSGVA